MLNLQLQIYEAFSADWKWRNSPSSIHEMSLRDAGKTEILAWQEIGLENSVAEWSLL